MTEVELKEKRRFPIGKISLRVILSLIALLAVAVFILSVNLNRLVADAIEKQFQANIISDVYELRFDKLRINLMGGDIRVVNLVLQPRSKPAKEYPYINSSIRLTARTIVLHRVRFLTLLRDNKLIVGRIEILKPDIQVKLSGNKQVFFPYRDTAADTLKKGEKIRKQIESYALSEFGFTDANLELMNSTTGRHLKATGLSIRFLNVKLSQKSWADLLTFGNVNIKLQQVTGVLPDGALRNIDFTDFSLNIDTLNFENTNDTLIYRYANMESAIRNIELHTADSIFKIAANSVNISCRKKTISLSGLEFKPDVSQAKLNRMSPWQKALFSCSAASASFTGVEFDTLLYRHQIHIARVVLDRVDADIYKDKTKPLNMSIVPDYPGQMIRKIKIPLRIDDFLATNFNLINTEKKPDGQIAKVGVLRGKLEATHITNLSLTEKLAIKFHAYIDNKVGFSLGLLCSYSQPTFSFRGDIERFSLPELNRLIREYTPATFNTGIADKISFTGNAYPGNADGNMTFLYHKLEMDMHLTAQGSWKNSVVAFAANTAVNSANPMDGSPPRLVTYHVDRDMHRGFINIVLRSFFGGMKETILMSKENRKAQKERKRLWKNKENDADPSAKEKN
jgi:hypothetical protein